MRLLTAVLGLSAWLLASSASGATIFVVQGTLGHDAELSGTVAIDTITGSLDAVDLYVDPVLFGQFPSQTLHFDSATVELQYGLRTFMWGIVHGGWADAQLWMTLGIPDLVGFDGGQLMPTTSVLIFRSGLIVRSTVETTQDFYYPLYSGTMTPFVAPEPGTFLMAALGLIGLAFWGCRRKR